MVKFIKLLLFALSCCPSLCVSYKNAHVDWFLNVILNHNVFTTSERWTPWMHPHFKLRRWGRTHIRCSGWGVCSAVSRSKNNNKWTPLKMQIIFKEYKEMQVGLKVSRRLLVRATELVKSKLKLKISQPKNVQIFQIHVESTELQPGGTISITVEFLVPRSLSQNLQVLILLLLFASFRPRSR